MAKPAQSKSEAIRTYLTDHPNASPDEVLQAVGKRVKGLKKQLIYQVKGQMGLGRRQKQGTVRPAAKPETIGAHLNGQTETVKATAELINIVQRFGSIGAVHEALDVLETCLSD